MKTKFQSLFGLDYDKLGELDSLEGIPPSTFPSTQNIDALTPRQEQPTSVIPEQEPTPTTKKIPLSQFLKAMSGIESSFGQNVNHKPVYDKTHKGSAAVGQYGLMPETVKDIVGRISKNKNVQYLKDIPNEQIREEFTKNPQTEQQVAQDLARYLMGKGLSAQEAALAWQWGHNRKPGSFQDLTPTQKERLQKFQSLRKKLNF